jgi:hypothetical protein
MATFTRQQLLDLESEELARIINSVPGELQDRIILLVADTSEEYSIEIPDEYL